MPSYKTTQRWRTKARLWITQYGGGCCQLCSYNAYIGNLVFHHLDARTKKEIIARLINRTASWSVIMAEADKCVLLCHNCHGEVHAGLKLCPAIDQHQRQLTLSTLIDSRPLPLTKQFHDCRCGKRIQRTQSFCSQACCHDTQLKINWPHDLPLLVANSSKRAVALKLGVSDKAVAKRLSRYHKEPMTGIEPAMDFSAGLQNQCTTVVRHRHIE